MTIEGYFNQNDEPVVTLDLISTSIEALIDTGFAGGLIIPEALASGLTLHFEGVAEFITATGQEFFAPAYTVAVNWFGQRLEMPIPVSAEVREGLLGGQMLEECRLTIDYAKLSVRIVKSST